MRLQDAHLILLHRAWELDGNLPQDDKKLDGRSPQLMDLLEEKMLKREGKIFAITKKGLKAINQ